MANVSKIKLPDNTTRDIVDSRISSVDSTISSSSTGVVQNNAIAAEFAKVAYIGTGIDSATYSDGGIVVDISNKADKVTGATSGNFASLDSNGNLADSGHKHSDYQAALVSGTNIKTINNESLLGFGNLTVGELPAVSTWGHFLVSEWDNTSSSYKWKVNSDLYFNSSSALQIDYSGGVFSPVLSTKSGPQGNAAQIYIDSRGLVGEAWNNQSVYSDWSWIKYRSSYSPSAYVTLQDTLDSIGLPPVTSADYGKMLFVDYDSTNGYHWSKNAPFHYESHFLSGDAIWGISLFDTGDGNITFDAGNSSNGVIRYWMNTYLSQQYKNWNWIRYTFYDSTEQTRFEVSLQDTLDTKQDTLVSGTNIKTINSQSLLGSGNITISGGGDTSSCVHKTGDETVGGDKTFTDDVIVGDASNIKYGASSGSAGFTKGIAIKYNESASSSVSFTGLAGEPKAFVINIEVIDSGVLLIVGDSTGVHGIYNTGSQHNYSASFTKSYSNGTLTITAPTGVTFAERYYDMTYYYGDGTLTFKTTQVQPGSGVTAVTFTGNGLTEVPAMYACFLESAVNNEQYRRVAGYTNSAADDETPTQMGITFVTGGPENTTSSFSVSYNNGLVINSGGTNAGGYFHNPGTYTLYYLMASDIGGGGSGSYSSLADELAAINSTIGDIATILASI